MQISIYLFIYLFLQYSTINLSLQGYGSEIVAVVFSFELLHSYIDQTSCEKVFVDMRSKTDSLDGVEVKNHVET